MKTFSHYVAEALIRESDGEPHEIHFGYDQSHFKHGQTGLKKAHAAGLKINHVAGGGMHYSHPPHKQGKPHAKPDITVSYDYGDEPHKGDAPASVALHSKQAKSHLDSVKHFHKAEGEQHDW